MFEYKYIRWLLPLLEDTYVLAWKTDRCGRMQCALGNFRETPRKYRRNVVQNFYFCQLLAWRSIILKVYTRKAFRAHVDTGQRLLSVGNRLARVYKNAWGRTFLVEELMILPVTQRSLKHFHVKWSLVSLMYYFFTTSNDVCVNSTWKFH